MNEHDRGLTNGRGMDRPNALHTADAQSKIQNPKSKIARIARILVVDDEAHILQVLSIKLRNAGYEVITAGDGEEAFDLACRHVPDLVITDFQMPYMTGLELCRAMAANRATAHLPVIMLTARGYALDPEDLAITGQASVGGSGGSGGSGGPMIRDVLSKPFSPRAVVDRIGKILHPSTHHNHSTSEAEAA